MRKSFPPSVPNVLDVGRTIRNRPLLILSALLGILFPAHAGESAGAVKYTAVLLRPLPSPLAELPPSMGGGGRIDPAASLVEAIRSGDTESLDDILNSGAVGIDEPICFTSGQAGAAFETGKRRWSLPSINLAAAANKALNPTGDPLHAPFIPSVPGVSAAGDAWTTEAGGQNMYGLGDFANLHGTPLMVAARFGNRFMLEHLLKKGANPNVFIVVGEASNGICGMLGSGDAFVSRPYLFALEECYRVCGAAQDKTRAKMDECAKLLIEAGAILPPADRQGRNGLWDAAIARSIPMLELALKSGLDVNATDHLDKTVLDYVALTPLDDGDLKAFAKSLRDKGATGEEPGAGSVKPQPLVPGEDDTLPPKKLQDGAAGGATGPPASLLGFGGTMSRPVDRSEQIAELEIRLRALRSQLSDARHDADMAAINGTGWVTASMRVQNIMRMISETEGELLRLQR